MLIKEKMKDLKKELLLEEASVMFEAIGYEQMKVAELAKRARVSVGTIYAIFNSKEGLYISYIEYQINNLFAELEVKISPESTPKERIHAYIEAKFEHVLQKRKAIEQGGNNPLFFTSLYSEHANPFEKIFTFLNVCLTKVDPSLDEVKAKRMAYALNGLMDGYITLWLELDDDLLEKVDEVYEMFLKIIEE